MYSVVLITVKNSAEAKKIGRQLLEEKLVACANIVKGVESLFWWEGKIDSENEVLVVLKTKRRFFNKIAKLVKSMHSYDVPEIIALPIINGYNPYLKWIGESTKKNR